MSSILIEYYPNGNKKKEEYFYDDKTHRDHDLPAEIWYYPNGNKLNERWFQNGILKRENKPVYISYNFEGGLQSELYYNLDKNIKYSQFYDKAGNVYKKI